MGNFFGEIAHRVGDLVSHPIKITKDTITNPKKGLKEWGDLYTHNEHKDQDLFQKGFGIKGWVGKHPQEFAGAVVATIFGGWAAWGAYGAGAAGGATAGATGAAGGTAGGSGIAAGTAIGQTVPATPGMIAAANGGGAAIGTGANAVSASYAATAGSGTSYSILAGSGYGVNGAYPTTLGGEAQIGSASGTNPAAMPKTWQDYAQQYGRQYQSQQKQQQSQQQQIDPGRIDYNRVAAPTNFGGGQASAIIPNSTTDIINQSGNKQFNSNSFGGNY